MRIIGGEKGGLVISVPMKGWPTRPTTDISKEALYNILQNRIDFSEVSFVDLFGGTGAHSLEFLSRGCSDVTYVDQYGRAVRWFKEIIKQLEYSSNCDIYRKDIRKFIVSCSKSFDVVFADPPYALDWIDQLPDLIFDNDLVSASGLLIIEHGSNTAFANDPRLKEERKYGQSKFSFFSLQ